MSDNINNVNAPANWSVLTNNGTNLTAVNNKSGESFSGTTSDFNTLVSAAVVRTAPAEYVLGPTGVVDSFISPSGANGPTGPTGG
jgi:C4-dicarboxylate-specific signal transduction histidine kinase